MQRTWPYGTRYKVKVEFTSPVTLIVVGMDEAVKHEAFVLYRHGVRPEPELNSLGYITFTRGGPTGGYWVFSKD